VSKPWEVTAVRYGSLESHKSELIYRYESYGEPDEEVEMAYYFWLLRREGETVLVDTGFDPVVGTRRRRSCLVPPVEALRSLGVDPEQVKTVLITHCHYDHVGNVAAFPRAMFIVPRKELDFWTSPLASKFQFASHVERDELTRLEHLASQGRLRTTDGTEEVVDGVTAICVGGHSPGQQVTTVRTGDGTIALASDAVHFYEELERERPFGVIADLAEMYAAYDVLKELAGAGAAVVPGHDPDVLHRYPALEGSDGNAVRLG
jgi:glyoxylase-like metal-dependent hydrolase (beta-lactamase superfamily II)